MTSKQPVKVFISYSHKDKILKDKLMAHLDKIKRDGYIIIWDDEKIKPGNNWLDDIEGAIESADIAIPMISANFLSSSFIQNKEVVEILTKKEQYGLQIMPLIISICK